MLALPRTYYSSSVLQEKNLPNSVKVCGHVLSVMPHSLIETLDRVGTLLLEEIVIIGSSHRDSHSALIL